MKIPQHSLDAMNDIDTFVPPHTRSSLVNYIERGYPPGGFITAVLSNDLKGAVLKADHFNKQSLSSIVAWCWNHMPAVCWGSQDQVSEWLSKGPEKEGTTA